MGFSPSKKINTLLSKFNLHNPKHPSRDGLTLTVGFQQHVLELFPLSHPDHAQTLEIIHQCIEKATALPSSWITLPVAPGCLQIATPAQSWILRVQQADTERPLTRQQLSAWTFVKKQLNVL